MHKQIAKKIRLSKVLAQAGVAARRKCEVIIQEGRVTVNGEKTLVPQTLVDPQNDKIIVDKKPLKVRNKSLYFILNKPRGYVCSAAFKDSYRVLDLFQPELGRLFTVGRLDKETIGLLIVTNDGHFANRVIHPSSNIEKEYLVKVADEVTDAHLKQLAKGCFVEGIFIKPKAVQKVRKGTVKIVIKEGKKREVRKLFDRMDLPVRELKRIRIGRLVLGTIPEGHFRSMTEREKELIFE